jgi:CheY-like chemotaxis protein
MSKKILLVEDDPDGQFVMGELLASLDCSVDLAASVAEAENYIFKQHGQYDIAIIDLSLPDRSGWELLQEIQDSQALAPCIAVTAYHSAEARQQALEAGFQAYFAQPLNVTQFTRSLDDLLKR